MAEEPRFHIHHVLRIHETRLRKIESASAGVHSWDDLKSEFADLKHTLENNKIQVTTNKLELSNVNNNVDSVNTKMSVLENKFENLDQKISELLQNTSNFCEQLLRLDAQNSVMNKRVEALEEAQIVAVHEDESEQVEEN